MSLKYNFNLDNTGYSDFLPKFKINLEAARDLIETLNLSGAFSQELIGKFWVRTYMSIENILNKYEFKNKALKDYDFDEDIKSFKAIYEPYCIFSEKFKHRLITLFLQVLHQPSEKKK